MFTVRTRPGNGGRCFHPGDEPVPSASVSPCFHPGDEPVPSASVSPCFHPGDEDDFAPGRRDGAPAARVKEPVSPCFHPGDENPQAGHPGDDLAADLHLSLTGIDERHLAVLANRTW
jgi:hypothetical protein